MSRRHRLAIALWLAALAVAGWLLATRTRITTDLAGFLPTSASPAEHLLVDQLKNGVAFRLVLMDITGAPPQRLAGLSTGLVLALKRDPSFSYVGNGGQDLNAAERRLLFDNRYLLSPAVVPGHFDAAHLRGDLRGLETELASPLGLTVKDYVRSDPTGEFLRVLRDWMPVGGGPSMRRGVWFSPDGKRALVVAETKGAGFDPAAQQRADMTIKKAFAALDPGPAHLQLSGTGVLAARSRAVIERDSWRLSALASILVLTLLFTVYRSARVVVLGILPVASGLAIGVATVGQVFGSVHGITLGFGATLIGEAVDYPVYLFTHVGPGQSVGDALPNIRSTLRLAVLTTVFGALAMLLSSVTGLEQLGLLSIAGVGTSGLVTAFVLPALAPTRFGDRKMQALPTILARMVERAGRAAPLAWALLAASVTILGVHANRLWDDNLSHLSPVPESAKMLDQRLRADVNAPGLRYLIAIDGDSVDAALRSSEKVAVTLRSLVKSGAISGFDMAARYLPSRETQRSRQAALPAAPTLAAALATAQKGLPFTANAFAPFRADVAAAKHVRPLGERDFKNSALAMRIQSLLMRQKNHWIALVPLRGVRDFPRVAKILSTRDHVTILDLKSLSNRMVAHYRRQSLLLTGLGIVIIALVVLAGLRDLAATGRVLAPVLIAVITTAAALVAWGDRLSLFNLVSLLLVIGIGLNYALFFNRPDPDPEMRRRTQLALVVCALSTLSAFGALALSQTPVLHAIGTTVALGAALSLLLSMALRRQPCDNIRPSS